MSVASTEPLPNVEPPMWRNILLVGVGCVATLIVSWWLSRPAARPTHGETVMVASAKPADPSALGGAAIPGAPSANGSDSVGATAAIAPATSMPKDLPLIRPRPEIPMVPLAALKSAQKQEADLRLQLAQARKDLGVAQQTLDSEHRRNAPPPPTDAERLLRTLKPALISSQEQ